MPAQSAQKIVPVPSAITKAMGDLQKGTMITNLGEPEQGKELMVLDRDKDGWLVLSYPIRPTIEVSQIVPFVPQPRKFRWDADQQRIVDEKGAVYECIGHYIGISVSDKGKRLATFSMALMRYKKLRLNLEFPDINILLEDEPNVLNVFKALLGDSTLNYAGQIEACLNYILFGRTELLSRRELMLLLKLTDLVAEARVAEVLSMEGRIKKQA